MDINKELRLAISTGKVHFGLEQTRKAIEAKKAKLIIVSSNCPDKGLRRMRKVRIYKFNGTNPELGAACGKPFSISTLAILNPGQSSILSL